MGHHVDLITQEQAATLATLFRERVERTPDRRAYLYFDRESQQWRESTWREMAVEVARWQEAMVDEEIEPGERVAVLLHNSREWVKFDQAALGLGLVTVPLYVNDNPENSAYILDDADVRLLFVEKLEQWKAILATGCSLEQLKRVIVLNMSEHETAEDKRLIALQDWLPEYDGQGLYTHVAQPDELATIVYTSGTTGRPKGVMLSHRNILADAHAGLQQINVYDDDLFLSFLPLSHTLERTVGYYIPMMSGATVAYARSIPELAEDLQTVKPTIMISVPRIFERVYGRIKEQLGKKPPLARHLFELAVKVGWQRFEHQQGRLPWQIGLLLWPLLKLLVAGKVIAKLGGRLRFAISGGAPLSSSVSHVFLGLGLPVVQGYGLTETSPVISVNQLEDNVPDSVGTLLPGVEARTGDNSELLVRGPTVMLGYWKHPEATKEIIDAEGWLHTGDKVRLDNTGHIQITGRLKDVIVLANGEKLPPADMEQAIMLDPLFEQALVAGEARPYLTALVVPNREKLEELLQELKIDSRVEDALDNGRVHDVVLARIADALTHFPGYAHIPKATLSLEHWTVDNGLLTPTLKVKRDRVLERFSREIEQMYQGH
jgi:long-chain acyl-CoA synthetase